MGQWLTIDDIQAAHDRGEPLDFSRHALEIPCLTMCESFFPLGFAVELRTNSEVVMSQARELWSGLDRRFENKAIRVDVHVVDDQDASASEQCPPAPVARMLMPLLYSVADASNYSVANLDEGWTRVIMARATERHSTYVGYFFLGSAPLCHIASKHTTPIHAGCVSFKGRGMLLCGDSGAGKSSLSYACARAGWTYTTDDASFLLQDGSSELNVTGNCQQVRFRPSASVLFPEIEGMEITPRAAGKPSIEMPTSDVPWIECAPTASISFLIFLNRRTGTAQELAPFSKEIARYYLRQVLFGSCATLKVQYGNLERLLSAEVLELRYTDLDWAVERLQTLAEEGR
jgi:hypothetical protein